MILPLYRAWLRARNRAFTVLARGSFHRIGRRSVIELPVRVSGARRISIGSGVFVGAGSWLQVLGETTPPGNPAISIGDGCSFAGYVTISAASEIVIEESVLVARYVYLADHRHEFSDTERPVLDQGIAGIAPVRIRSGAWLGQGVVVCPGVTIGRNAVIGANSIVRSDIPDCCVAAGQPAKVIRRVDE